MHSTSLFNSTGHSSGILVVLNDVTQLRQLENMRRDFAANVSHEIKTPLTAIKGFVETLRHSCNEKPEETERFIGIVEKHVDRLAAIVDDLISLSKIEQDDEKQEITLQKGPVKTVLQAAVGLGVSPYPLLMAVAVSASTAFLTPIGTTTNLMVSAPGAYSFRDFIHVGAPLVALFMAVSLLLLPLIWPF